MKQLLPVHQENNFQELQIFEASMLNEYCDEISHNIKNMTGSLPILVGSVSKMLSGDLPDDYKIKDIDFAVFKHQFRLLAIKKNNILPKAYTVELLPRRIIIHLHSFAIEIWSANDVNPEILLFNNKIPYIICQ